MNPEPLTKEKIDEKIIWNRFWSIIRKLPIMKMRRKHDKEVIGLQMAFEGEILHIQRDVKSAVNLLLKEIEKEKKKIENLKPIYNDYGNYEDWTCPICKIHFKEETKAYEHVEWEKRELRKTKGKMLNWFEDLIKKAFEGVVND